MDGLEKDDEMGLLIDFLAAAGSKDGFWIGWKRIRCIRNRHPYEDNERLEKLHSEKHPHTNSEYIYTVNIMRCRGCGLIYNDVGLEQRDG